jgi:deoxyribonuclease IV
MLIGAHIHGDDPIGAASEVGADCIQMFVGPPQSWKQPPPRPDADRLKSSSLPIYVHAPYPVNVASPNNRIRIPSRKILGHTIERAEEIGAAGLIVHAGHAEDGIHRGFMRWRKVFEEIESPVPILIENTAGGTNAMGRYVEDLARLWEQIDDFDVGFCFDTCHAHAAGEDLADVVDRVLAVVGKIDLVHANDSRDGPGTGADRHANFAVGRMNEDDIVEMVRASKSSTIICETPWAGIADDIAYLRKSLN